MSLCLAREGNFCAKLTWCPLAGRRLVSGSDLHLRPCILHFHLSHPANPSNQATDTHRKLRNPIIASLGEDSESEINFYIFLVSVC